jgi:glycosyltransferase involved in cell wall biosynthesis
MSDQRIGRVLLVASYFPPHKGGVEFFASSIAEQLSVHFNWDVAVVTTGEERYEQLERKHEGLRIYRLPYRRKLSNSPLSVAWLWRVWRIIRDEAPDLINIHTPVPGLGDLTSIVAGDRSIVLNYHSGPMRKERSRLNAIIWIYEQVLAKPMLYKARQIISSSEYVRNGILARFKHKTLTITPGVDSDMFRPPESPVDSEHVIFVGSLNKSDSYKNLSGLLAACQKLVAIVPDLKLTVVGDGDGRAGYEQLASNLGLDDMTTFTGSLDREALADAYRAASVFALPSAKDSFPLVITEAMASGLPVVSSNIGGIPTLVDDGVDGLLVSPTDVGALAEALARVLTDKTLARQMGRAGREKAVRRLSWLSRAEMTDAVFRNVVASRDAVNQPVIRGRRPRAVSAGRLDCDGIASVDGGSRAGGL